MQVSDNGTDEFTSNCFIGFEEKTEANKSFVYQAQGIFIEAFEEGKAAPSETIYAFIQLKDELSASAFECCYSITIEYQVG